MWLATCMSLLTNTSESVAQRQDRNGLLGRQMSPIFRTRLRPQHDPPRVIPVMLPPGRAMLFARTRKAECRSDGVKLL